MHNKAKHDITEAKYIRSNHKKQTEKRRVHKTQRIVSTAVVLLCCAFLVLGGVNVVAANTFAYQIVANGEALATLPSEQEALTAIEQYLDAKGEEMGFIVTSEEQVEIQRVSSKDAVYSSLKDAAESLDGNIGIVAQAMAICIDGTPVLYVADKETALQAVDLAKKHYASTDSPGVIEVSTVEQVAALASNTEPTQVLSAEEASQKLLFGTAEVDYHFVASEGETFEYIANRYGLTVEDVEAANPQADSTNLQVGAAVLVTKVEPMIHVQVKRTQVAVQEIPYSTEKRDNYELSRGEEKVIVEGLPGQEEVTYEVVEENGKQVDAIAVASVTLEAPVTQVVDRGAKIVVASRSSRGTNVVSPGSGQLGLPYNGYLSSRFGPRSLGNHSGIDIAGPIGDNVAASEAGTVTKAEYYYGYGLLVIVDHGDGLETYYGHLSGFAVGVGDTVARGQLIGYVGTTGRVTGPHVHFEVRYNGVAYDPLPFLDTTTLRKL